MIPTPTLCRLCHRPIPRAALKCPYCGARLAWSRRARAGGARGPRRGWRIAFYTTALALVAVAVVIGLSVLREIKAPIAPVDGTSPPTDRPSAAECAEVLSELARATAADRPLAPEARQRVRRCFDRR